MNNNLYLIIKNFIKCEYSMRSDIITNLCKHIDNLNRENIIHYSIRNKLMSDTNNCILKLNTTYNDAIHTYKKINYEPSAIERTLINTLNYESIMSYSVLQDNLLKKIIAIYFENIDDDIYNIMKKIGSLKLEDLLKFSIGENYYEIMGIKSDINNLKQYIQDNKSNMILDDLLVNMHNSAALIDILNKCFNPVEMYIYKGFNNSKTTVLIKKYIYDKYIGSEESSKFKYEIMLENCYKITIKCAITNKCFVIIGYFDYDVINSIIATSQICNNYIYYKKKLLIEYVKKNAKINNSFKDSYLTNISLGDILCFKGSELVDKMLIDYNLYTRSLNIKFKTTVNDFLKADLNKKFNILKCLLLGPKNSIKNGAMLFGMTKDQNRDGKNNKSCVADILFKNLNHSQQLRLKKSGQYIKQELDRIKKMSSDDMDLKQQCIMNNNMSDAVKKSALSRLEEMKSNNSEYHKNHTYVKILIDYPWVPEEYTDMFTTIGSNIEKCREKLKKIKEDFDKKVFGQEEFKNIIGDLVGKWFSNPNSMGKAIGLCGPPGVGKTLIASGMGKVLDIPCQEIHLGGMEDGSVLNGHSFTYSGAQPGLIITKMVMSGQPRCILFFDELDKTCSKHGINEIYNVLIHATDPNTNDKFSDKFFNDVNFPLNKCIFVFSFNDASKIDPILKERMEIINISPYSQNDKIIIAKKYLIPSLLEGVGIEKGSVKLSKQTIEHIINKYTLEAGVRGLKNNLEKIFLKLNIDRIYTRGPFKNRNKFSSDDPISISKQHIIKYLGKSKIIIEKIHTTNQIGVVNGLYATTIGSGGIIPILVYPAKSGQNRFTLEMTGKQGKVMRESINFAWIIAKNCVKSEIVEKFYKSNHGGIHVHTPDGATPKDGPSAGSAFSTAFISRLTGLCVKKEIAMTGEIGISGDVTAIGGLEHKLTGAKIAGVKFVFVCRKNIDDIKKIKEINPGLFNLINPNNDKDVQTIINNLCKKKILIPAILKY